MFAPGLASFLIGPLGYAGATVWRVFKSVQCPLLAPGGWLARVGDLSCSSNVRLGDEPGEQVQKRLDGGWVPLHGLVAD